MRKRIWPLAFTLTAASTAAADITLFEAPDGTGKKVTAYGWVQPRLEWQQRDERQEVRFEPNKTLVVQRARIGLVARVNGWARGVIEFELGPFNNARPMIDAFVAAGIPEIEVRAGQMRVPFSRQNMIQSRALQLADMAYFIQPHFIQDRDQGVLVTGKPLDGRIQYFAGVYDGNEPGRDRTTNEDPYLLYGGRLEVHPLGEAPRFEGDLRTPSERRRPLFALGGGAMRNRVKTRGYTRTYVGGDAAFYFHGASLYGEVYRRNDKPTREEGSDTLPPKRTLQGFNVQVGFFPPFGWLERHVEAVVRFQQFDPWKEVKNPGRDNNARDLASSDASWGYRGIAFGVNVFPEAGHDLKLQASYEIRNETKRCLEDDKAGLCTGYIKNNLAVLQATAAFLSEMNMNRSKLTALATATLLCVGAGALAVACQNTDTTSGVTNSGTGGAGGSSNPASAYACAYGVPGASWMIDFAQGTPVVAGDPKIRRVRAGLGGTQKVDANKPDPSKSFAVAWQTDDGTLASEVTFGKDPDATKWAADARVGGFTWKTPEGVLNANGDQRMHEVHVCNLEPDTTYYYRVGGGAAGSEVWSDVIPFRTAPADGSGEVTIAVTGDSRGQQDNAWQLLEGKLASKGVSLQLFSGDMINLGPDQKEWELWLDKGSRDAAGKPSALSTLLTVAAHGNHDNHTSLFFGNVVAPADGSVNEKFRELFFAFDYGPVHVVVVDDMYISSEDADYDQAVSNFLDADLGAANANRANVPWIVAVHHHPEYSSSLHGKDAAVTRVRNFLVPIWNKQKVDLSLAGHDHNYERSKPLSGDPGSPTIGSTNKDGTTYVVCAGSGADPYSSGTSSFTAASKDYKSAIGLYSLMKASKTKLSIEAHLLTSDGSDPVIDTAELSK